MKVDIISSVFGNKKVVDPCVSSWFPLPSGWTLSLYDNVFSGKDGTKEMLLKKKSIYNFNIIDEGIDLKHAEALNKLIQATTSEWILMLDSDAYLKSKEFYTWVEEIVFNDDGSLFWGIPEFSLPNMRTGWKPALPTYIIPRTSSWIMLINRKFMRDNNIKPDPIRIEGNIRFGKIWNKDGTIAMDSNSNEIVRVAGDVGWQFYSTAIQFGVFKKIPDNIINCWKHVGHASCNQSKSLQ